MTESASVHRDASPAAGGTDGGQAGAGGAGASDAGHAGGASGTLSGPDGSASPCNYLPEPRRGAQVQVVQGTAPAPSGGTIRDGVYELYSAVVYVAGKAEPSIEGRAHTISISGHSWASVSYFDNAPTTRYDDEVTISGSAVSLKRVCGATGSGILFDDHGAYTASDSTLALTFAAGPAFGDGTAVLAFRRAPELDGGAACIGTPCANSYGCCPRDGGGPPFGIACGASGTCEACNTNGLNDPCLGRSPSSPEGPDCCPGLTCVNNRCVR